ncbi:hypothetical protein ACIBCN_20875 [Nocardia sp. NPDC051052]
MKLNGGVIACWYTKNNTRWETRAEHLRQRRSGRRSSHPPIGRLGLSASR